ncbi:DUF29 domain-containing protein [Gammaproteobacteria bacterium]
MSTHETDFYSWTQEQATLLKQGRYAEVDHEHLIEELESMGASERRELINRLAVLLAHLLKWQHQPERRSNSWRLTVEEQRRKVRRVLRQNPSLKPTIGESIEDAYGDALLIAARETGFNENAFPKRCPWAISQVLDSEFWPDSVTVTG